MLSPMSPDAGGAPPQRVVSVDLLRGLVMVVMALDHTRDFVHAGAMNLRPDDLATTTTAIFFTRWVTHICAPAFVLCAGLGAWLRLSRDGNKKALSWFLLSRGLWLLVLELTLVPLVFFFHWPPPLVFLLVFWSIGMSMIALAGLIYLPVRVLAIVGFAMIALHNLTDKLTPETFGALAPLWRMLHQQGLLVPGPPAVIVAYPLIPWIGVMALGFCLGEVYRLTPDRRRRLLIGGGLAMVAAFVVLRVANVYGDPRPWTWQPRTGFTLLSFLNTTKYPPSLAFLLMTLGPSLVLLGLFDRMRPSRTQPLLVFGRTPLFYFVVHLAVIHALEIGLTWWRYGAAPFLWMVPPTVGSPRDAFPADYGWSLGATYLAWAFVVAVMYLLCRWFGGLKARGRGWWWGYV
jgi:uncharacterized membrane protein